MSSANGDPAWTDDGEIAGKFDDGTEGVEGDGSTAEDGTDGQTGDGVETDGTTAGDGTEGEGIANGEGVEDGTEDGDGTVVELIATGEGDGTVVELIATGEGDVEFIFKKGNWIVYTILYVYIKILYIITCAYLYL